LKYVIVAIFVSISHHLATDDGDRSFFPQDSEVTFGTLQEYCHDFRQGYFRRRPPLSWQYIAYFKLPTCQSL